ncbi:hypothetical protein, partial [Burkholderia multivorans]|uniref:hypothetical protein n=1 Tax=Burkholderia multivorans TaxID=87883 RepID=UPI0021C05DCF
AAERQPQPTLSNIGPPKRCLPGKRIKELFNGSTLKNAEALPLLLLDAAKNNTKTTQPHDQRRGAHGRRSRVLDQNMRRTDSTRRAGNGGQRVASFCSSAAAFLSPCAVIAASATSRDRASTPIRATPLPAHQPPTDRRILDRRNITTPIHDHQRRSAQKPKQQAIPTQRDTNRSES